MQFAEEPLLQFVFGPVWGEQNYIAFDKVRYDNGLRDKKCIDAIKTINSNQTVIVILIDDLRKDHLSIYGYERATSPFLDSLYRSGSLVKVNHAFSTSTNTIGGIAALFFSKGWREFGFNGLSLMKFLYKSSFTTYAFLTGFHRDWYGLSALYRNSCDYYFESAATLDVKNFANDFTTLDNFRKKVS